MTKKKPSKPLPRIGLIGVPGSGKTAVASKLSELGFDVIDNYAPDLAKSYDIYIGPHAQYISNLFIAQDRELEERSWDLGPQGKGRVTCGTLLDTLAYLAAKVEVYSQAPKTDLNARRLYREMSAAQVVSLMMEELWRYTHTFYLPLNPDALIDVPGAEPEPPGEFLRTVDVAINTGIMKWRIPATTLPLGMSAAERVETILKSLEEDDDRGGNGDHAIEKEDSAPQSAS